MTDTHGRAFAQNGPVLSACPKSHPQPAEVVPPRSGARSGALLAAASAASIILAYAFLLAAGRILGSEDYGSLAALLGLLSIVLIPAGALQMSVSRDVSRRAAAGDTEGAMRLARGTLRAAAIGTVPLVAVGLALAAPLSRLLHIHSVPVVVLAVLTLSTALVFPVALGVLQGQQRFPALAALSLFPWLVRLALLGIVAGLGYRLGGAVLATLVGAVATTALALGMAPDAFRGTGSVSRAELLAFFRELRPVVVGLVGIALLTHVDLLIVKARFSAHEAGAYAGAAAFARVGFFLPAAILTVLFPRTAARQARGEETEDILGRSLLATAGFCGLLAVVYAAAGTGLVALTFGRGFSAGGSVLAPFALAIGLYSIANVLVGYHLSRGEGRYAWIVALAVLAQVAALALVPARLHTVVWTNVVVGVALLAAHELFVTSSVPALRAGLRHFVAGSGVAVRRVAVEALAVLFAVTLLVCILMWPVVAHLSSTISGSLGSDSTGSVAFLWTLQHESGYHILGTTHHTLSGAPFGWNEGNGLNIQWFLPYYPAYLATKLFGAVAAYNLITLAGYILSGAAMYLLVRYLRCSRAVAAWAALVFVIFPWHFARTEHASLTHLDVLVLLVLALVAATRRSTWSRFGLVGLATLACWLTSGYFGGMAVITAAAFAVGAAVVLRRQALLLVPGIVGAVVLASGAVAIASYASGTNAGAGIGRDASSLTAYGLRPIELVVPAARHLVFGGGLDAFWVRHAHGSNTTEISNYLGLLTFALALTWIVVVVRRRRDADMRALTATTAGLVVAFLVGLLFALPSPLGGLQMPSKLLWDVLPAFRVPSRWDPLLMTVLLPLAALGLDRVTRAFRRQAAALAVVGLALVGSFLELATHRVAHFRTVPVPPEYTTLNAEAPNGILAEYPLGYSDIYRLWQRVHGRPLLNGAPEGSVPDEARLMLLDPAQKGTAELLSLLGVTAIAIHPGGHADVPVQPREPTRTSGYRLLRRYADGASVWIVTARAAPAFVTLAGGFAPPRALSDGTVGYPIVASSGIAAIELRAKAPGTIRLVFTAIPPSGGAHRLRIHGAAGERTYPLNGPTPLSLAVALPRGVSLLLLKTDPAATSESNAIVLTQPQVEPAPVRPVFHPQLESGDPGF